MNPITNDSNVINPYAQNPAAIAASKLATDVQPITATISVGGTQDSSQFSKQAIQALLAATQGSSSSNVASKDPLANLVSNGTITQDQSDSIKSAFQAARQSNTSGTYSSFQTNPISSLVANGTITQNQATAIAGDLKSAVAHHKHGGGKKIDSATQIDTTSLTSATDTTDATSQASAEDAFSTILSNLEASTTGEQNQVASQNAIESLIQNNGLATA